MAHQTPRFSLEIRPACTRFQEHQTKFKTNASSITKGHQEAMDHFVVNLPKTEKLKKCYQPWNAKEVLVSFWHLHFLMNVSRNSAELIRMWWGFFVGIFVFHSSVSHITGASPVFHCWFSHTLQSQRWPGALLDITPVMGGCKSSYSFSCLLEVLVVID